MANELTKWSGIREITIAKKEDLPGVKPALALGEAAIKALKSTGDFEKVFEISKWRADLQRQAGKFITNLGELRGKGRPVTVTGYSWTDARRWRLASFIPKPAFEKYAARQKKKLKEVFQHDLIEMGKKIERERNRTKTVVDERILIGRFQEQGSKIADGSVSLVLTDPPYDWKEGKDLEELAKFASEKLASGGAFLCYVGQTQLPFALDAFRKHLRYWWTIACLHEGAANLMQRYGIRASWKPILMFVKDTRHDTSHIFLDRVSGGEEKTEHAWQQAEAEAKYLIENLCPEDGLIVDPCLGSGTVGAAAEKLNRKWIGIEADPATAKKAIDRIGRK